MPVPPAFEVLVSGARMLAPGVRELVLERVDGAPVEFEAGQWMNLVLPLPTGEARRAYSIASAPNGGPTFEVAVTKVDGGPGSTYLHDLPVGAPLLASGPQGFFTRPRGAAHPALFVGTGTGVAPLRSMIKDALAAGEASPMTLLFGARREVDRLWREEFEELTARHPHFRAIYTLSQPQADRPGMRGYVQAHAAALWRELEGKGAGAPHVYICGLERMVSAVRHLFRDDVGVDRKRVHTERYD